MGEMLRYQNTLKDLPIPNLNETLEKYLKWIEPILSKDEFEETKNIVKEFGKENGEGQKLHEKLLQYKENIEGNKSWLFSMWDDLYLEGRYSIVPAISYCGLLNNDKYIEESTLEEILSKVAYTATEIYNQIAEGSFPVDMVKDNPLCMEQYLRVFKSMRMPNTNIDEYYVGELSTKNNHCIVFNNNNIYKLLLSDENGNIVSQGELLKSIEYITNQSNHNEYNPFIYTCTERDRAKTILDKVLVSETNIRNFEDIKNALFVMCIDDTTKSPKDTMYDLLISNGDNRCFDKSLQFIINKNKEIGLSVEHTGFDGSTVFGILKSINDKLDKNDKISKYEGDIKAPELLKFDLTDDIKPLLNELKEEQLKNLEDYHLNLHYFNDFGSQKIKELKVSPDAYFHIAVQLAQYKTFGKMRSTYESVAVKNFRQGRTECARPSSLEKLEFVKAFVENEYPKEKIYELLQRAASEHTSRIRECQMGMGVERHLFGLAKIQAKFKDELNMPEIPVLYKDKGYKELKTDFISTSGVGGEYTRYCAFGPQIDNGFGMFYTMNKNNIVINLASKMSEKDEADKFINNLVLAFNEIKNFIEDFNK